MQTRLGFYILQKEILFGVNYFSACPRVTESRGCDGITFCEALIFEYPEVLPETFK